MGLLHNHPTVTQVPNALESLVPTPPPHPHPTIAPALPPSRPAPPRPPRPPARPPPIPPLRPLNRPPNRPPHLPVPPARPARPARPPARLARAQLFALPTWGKVLALIAVALPIMVVGGLLMQWLTGESWVQAAQTTYHIINNVPGVHAPTHSSARVGPGRRGEGPGVEGGGTAPRRTVR